MKVSYEESTETYTISGRELIFQKVKLTHLNLKYPESALLVHAIKSLGEQRLTTEAVQQMARYLCTESGFSLQRDKAINKDTKYVTSWVREGVLRVLQCAKEDCCE